MATVVMPERSGDELVAAIEDHHRQMCAAHLRLLSAVAEHDKIESWRDIGARSEEDYLVRTLSVSWPTARDWVREARVLERVPELALGYEDGQMSADQLNSLCRLASTRHPEADEPAGPFDNPKGPEQPGGDRPPPDPAEPDAGGEQPGGEQPGGDGSGHDDENSGDIGQTGAELVELAGSLSARQLAQLASRARQRASAAEAAALHRRRHVRAVRDETQRRLSITAAELFDDDAATVWAAFTDYANGCKADPETGIFDPLHMRFADALVAMASAYLANRQKITHHPMVFFHADVRVLAGEDGWAETTDYSPIAAETARRLACACDLNVFADDADGNPLKLGRKVRHATWQQAETCRRRDGGCRMCGQRFSTQAHHIRWWERDHGRTDVTELATLCNRCHHLVHEGGWVVSGDPYGELTFTSPSGTIVRSRPQPQRPPGTRRTESRPFGGGPRPQRPPRTRETEPDPPGVPETEPRPPGRRPGRPPLAGRRRDTASQSRTVPPRRTDQVRLW